jgi:hypothetical protein
LEQLEVVMSRASQRESETERQRDRERETETYRQRDREARELREARERQRGKCTSKRERVVTKRLGLDQAQVQVAWFSSSAEEAA